MGGSRWRRRSGSPALKGNHEGAASVRAPEEPEPRDPVAVCTAAAQFWKKLESVSGPHNLQAVGELKAVKASTLAAKPWDPQRKSLHGQLEVTKRKLQNAQSECDKTCDAMVKLTKDYEKQRKLVSDLTAETQQLETQHKMAAEQALKEYLNDTTLSLERYIQNQFPPRLAPSAEMQTAIAQRQPLSRKRRPQQTLGEAATPAEGAGAGAAAPSGANPDLSAEQIAGFDTEGANMEEELDAAARRAPGTERAGEAVNQALNLNGTNQSPTPQQQAATKKVEKSAKALCTGSKGKGRARESPRR
ncbi:unnamed protein product [Prorocentrum cordatum]|uniref:Uncharacterized protein n=1 Tax=Prorocentrum cordatum TaxID=2364126 RepID=A0ABN9VCR7_9DINO|nr:unnamed protein product [Polarella glacialis]